MRISELGEFGLIARLAQGLGSPGPDVVVGIGDDVAVLRSPVGRYLLATCDVQVEGVHFLRDKITPRQLGRRAVAINVSDIASMGGLPRHALVSLMLPRDTDIAFVDGLYEGIQEECGIWGVDVVGGNMAHSPAGIIVDVFLVGDAEPGRILLRSGARVGDRILVTGTLGDSAAGLALLLNPDTICAEEQRGRLVQAHLLPRPRVREGQLIALSGWATAMIDVSDGLASDLGHICQQSKVGAWLWATSLPISEAARGVADAMGKEVLDWALFGGEDYELLFTCPPEHAQALAARVQEETGTPVTIIGEITPPDQGTTLVYADGGSARLRRGGWDHFGAVSG